MLVIVSYDVSTDFSAGKQRLRRVAKICESYGQRVQNSVFECLVDQALWVTISKKLIDAIDPSVDSLRFYFLGKKWKLKVEHIGAKPSYDPQGVLIL